MLSQVASKESCVEEKHPWASKQMRARKAKGLGKVDRDREDGRNKGREGGKGFSDA